MNLRQVKGNTWVLEGLEFIPLYRLDGGRCVLLDTGLAQEREELEQALLDHGLTPAGILCSHAHVDHGGNNRYFQEKYHIPVALTSREAGMCASLLSLKCYFLLLSPDMVEQDAAGLVHTPDVLIPDGDGPFSFAGAEFQILQTPGHSVGHISTLTPDRVCYVGDALLSREQLDAKLPYCLSHRMGMESREKLRGLDCDLVVMAHRGIARREELEGLIDANQALALPAGVTLAQAVEATLDGGVTCLQLREKTASAGEILALIDRPMAASDIVRRVCLFYKLLSGKPRRALRFERNIRFFIEFLVDRGDLVMETQDGVTVYRPAR